MRLALVALPVPLAHGFTYIVPEHLGHTAVPGARCLVPFRSRKLIGIVLSVTDGEPEQGTKSLLEVRDDVSFPEELLAFLQKLAAYYLAPIGEVVKLALPPLDRETERALKEPTLFDEGLRGVADKRVQWVRPHGHDAEKEKALRPNAASLLAHVRAGGGEPVARLSRTWKSARDIASKLASIGLVTVTEESKPDDPFFAIGMERDVAPELTPPQKSAVAAADAAIRAGKGEAFLLRGVTGSGKTEVYLHAIAVAKELGKTSIVLVPEIALTPQLVQRFRARFGDDVAVWHSALTAKERLGMWRKLRSGELDVVIGARSALFAPVSNLGLIVVDEEHDTSFKQEEGVRYHARDMALFRAHLCGAVAMLGSATPSLELAHLADTGKLVELPLPERARAQAMPEVSIIDLRRFKAGPTGDKRISLPLHRALEEVLAKGEQAILFLNRRGFSPSARCEACGKVAQCPHCSVALTYHKRGGGMLRCHYCDYYADYTNVCPSCSAPALELEGLGTERLEEVLGTAFPSAKIARLDRDVASGKQVEAILDRVRRREVDILVGTQMVTKGHDLPHVTLVGVINADAALSIPDFRATERAFHLLVQVAGRAGRGESAGKVLVQTYEPTNAAILFAKKHDVHGFMREELVARKELGYPPFSKLALVRVDAADENTAARTAAKLADLVRHMKLPELDVLGPAVAPLAKLRNRHRYRFLLRAPSRGPVRAAAARVLAYVKELPRTVNVVVDVDPFQLL